MAWFRPHIAQPSGLIGETQGSRATPFAAEPFFFALSGLLFLYREVLEREFGWLEDVVRAKRPKRLPVVFTPEEAMAIIELLQEVRWLMGMLLYGGGLRLMECLRLRVKDLDFEQLQVTVREG